MTRTGLQRFLRLRPPSFAIWMAAAALAIYAVVMLWHFLPATLGRGSAVTAWTHLATAPIQGRAPAHPPLIGATGGADGGILGVVKDRRRPPPGPPPASPPRRSRPRQRPHAPRRRHRLPRLGAGARPPAARADEAQRRRLPRRSRRRDRLARGARHLAGGQGGARRGDRRAQPQRLRRRLSLSRLSRRGKDPPRRGRGRTRRRAYGAAAGQAAAGGVRGRPVP